MQTSLYNYIVAVAEFNSEGDTENLWNPLLQLVLLVI